MANQDGSFVGPSYRAGQTAKPETITISRFGGADGPVMETFMIASVSRDNSHGGSPFILKAGLAMFKSAAGGTYPGKLLPLGHVTGNSPAGPMEELAGFLVNTVNMLDPDTGLASDQKAGQIYRAAHLDWAKLHDMYGNRNNFFAQLQAKNKLANGFCILLDATLISPGPQV